MTLRSIRTSLLASGAAALLAAGALAATPALAQQQQQPQLGQQQQAQTGQQQPGAAQQQQQFAAQQQDQDRIGRGPLPAPQWEYYSDLNPRYGALAWLPLEEVVGSPVFSPQGQPIAEVLGLVRRQADGDILFVLAPAPGQELVVPARELEVRGDRQLVYAGQQPLGALPTYSQIEREVTVMEVGRPGQQRPQAQRSPGVPQRQALVE